VWVVMKVQGSDGGVQGPTPCVSRGRRGSAHLLEKTREGTQ